MHNIQLIKPSMIYKESFGEVLELFKQDKRNGFWNVGGTPLKKEGIDQYIINTAHFEKGKHLPEMRMASHTYRLVDVQKNKFLGCINIRHQLNDFLEKYGGHVGYAIHPHERQQGYGSLILQLALKKVRQDSGLTKVLLTCNEDNIASKKIIEKNGGIYQNKILVEGEKYYKLRYWIAC